MLFGHEWMKVFHDLNLVNASIRHPRITVGQLSI